MLRKISFLILLPVASLLFVMLLLQLTIIPNVWLGTLTISLGVLIGGLKKRSVNLLMIGNLLLACTFGFYTERIANFFEAVFQKEGVLTLSTLIAIFLFLMNPLIYLLGKKEKGSGLLLMFGITTGMLVSLTSLFVVSMWLNSGC